MTVERPPGVTDQSEAALEGGNLRNPSIVLDALLMSYGENKVLRGLDLEVHPGQFVALVGPSGAGKSTLLSLLNGSSVPSGGRVEVLGVEPSACRRRELRKLRTQIGFVFQQFGLVGRLSALENVLMGSLGSLRLPRYGVMSYPKAIREKAVANLERVSMVDQRFQRCDTLSGGQQQRIAIARMLMQQARLVLADEPVASLDPAASISALETLRKLSAEDGFTVICSLHQVDLALQVSDRIVAVRDGIFVLDSPTNATGEREIRSVYGSHASTSDG